MKPSSLIGHVVELLESLSDTTLPPDAVIQRFFRERRYLGARDRRFITETFYGVLRNLRLCDHLLERTGDLLSGATGEGRSLLRVAALVLAVESRGQAGVKDFLETVEDSDDHTRLTEGLNELASSGDRPSPTLPPEIRFSFPDWMTSRLREQYGDESLLPLLESLNAPAPLSLRVNTIKTTVEDCAARLAREGVETDRGGLVPTSLIARRRMNAFTLGAFREGWFEVQDEGSQFLVALADPKPTARVLDMCAGAGGKTLALAALMKNRGEIVATDTSPFRLKELRKRMRRAGAGNIRINERFLRTDSNETFDLVLVDAPCTGVGTIRRNPGMKWTVSETMVAELSEKQSGILGRAAGHVKAGGLLVYATCSLFREENEMVVERFLRDNPSFGLEDPSPKLGQQIDHRVTQDGFVKLLPHIDTTDGFFVALLRKNE